MSGNPKAASIASAVRASSANMRDPEQLGSARALPITRPATAEPISHGGDLDVARKRYPDAPEPWIDLSTGINPVPFPIPDFPPEIWSRLPPRPTQEPHLSPPPP